MSDKMPTHVQRMKQEHADLSEKLAALGAFIYAENGVFDGLPKTKQGLMFQQYFLMKEYASVLAQRIWTS